MTSPAGTAELIRVLRDIDISLMFIGAAIVALLIIVAVKD
jgi:hypothetical protein